MSQYFAKETRQLRQTRFGIGYAADEVEPFVETVEAALRSPTPWLSVSDVVRKRFTPVLLSPGYRMDDVDSYLDEAAYLLGERARAQDEELPSLAGAGRHRRSPLPSAQTPLGASPS